MRNFLESGSVKKIVAAAGIMTVLAGMPGCKTNEVNPTGAVPNKTEDKTPNPTNSPTPTPEESAIASAVASAEATLVSTIEPTESPLPTLTPEVEMTVERKLELAPEIGGLKKEIRKVNGLERVIYVDQNGEYTGEYKYEVSWEGERVGGVALKPKIAEKILLDKIAEQTDEQGKWLIPLPVDISDMKTLNEIKIGKTASPIGTPNVMWGVDTGDEIVSVACITPGKGNKFWTSTLAMDQSVTVFDSEYTRGRYNDKMVAGKEMFYININTQFEGKPVCYSKKTFSFGDKIGDTSKEVKMLTGTNLDFILATFEKLLTTKDKDGNLVPIFIISPNK